MDIRLIGFGDPAWTAYWTYRNCVMRLLGGPHSHQLNPETMLARHQSMSYAQRPTLWGAFENGDLVGTMQSRTFALDTPIIGTISVMTSPEHSRRGIGSSLLEVGEEDLAARGATIIEGYAFHATSGDLGLHHAAEHFALRHGYRMVQKEVIRELPLPAQFEVHTDPAYRVIAIEGNPPDEWFCGLAVMKEHMATDAPHGDKEIIRETWDSERAREWFQPIPGHTTYYAAAFDSTGAMAGYTHLGCDDDGDDIQRGILHQADTLVLTEHRGHGLGVALKSAAISLAQERRPWLTLSRTCNAASNTPMIAINERLGFEVSGNELTFQKSMSSSSGDSLTSENSES
ncbi:MAG: GNAT family N-acetyltransferase [Propionibacteriaceae bacterium]